MEKRADSNSDQSQTNSRPIKQIQVDNVVRTLGACMCPTMRWDRQLAIMTEKMRLVVSKI